MSHAALFCIFFQLFHKTITASTHGPAVTLNIEIGQTKYDVDLTLAIKLQDWPPAANTWRTRSRRGWPSPELIKQVYQGGCHVVAKQPPVGCTDEEKKYLWRFSCSEGEKTIMNNMDSGIANSGRKRVLQILKSIVANDPQLKSVPLCSYHIKTVIFWESEKYPNGEDWHASKLQERVFGAFEKLVSFINKKSFPHYFLNHVNLVEQFKASHGLIVSQKYKEITKDPGEYFRSAIQRGTASRM